MEHHIKMAKYINVKTVFKFDQMYLDKEKNVLTKVFCCLGYITLRSKLTQYLILLSILSYLIII